ncbi:MAG: hypothetical protein R2932_12810 [Caldilineaceae bacterium]
MATTTTAYESTHRKVVVTASYITALSTYTDTTNLTLNWVDGAWVIDPQLADLTVPPDQFLRAAEVNWLSQGRRRVASGTTNFADVLDRPDLAILSARLVVRTPETYSVVGEVLNSDVDPADITVTSSIYDDLGNKLTWYNAGDVIIHKLLPLEITPFRIDFEGVAGAALAETRFALPAEEIGTTFSFAPNVGWDYHLPPSTSLGKFDLVAKAVVTQRDLYRALGIQEIQVYKDDAGELMIHGELINNDLRGATVPHLLITYYDEAGHVMWVDHHYLPTAIRPQRVQPFTFPVSSAATIRDLQLPGEIYTNSLQEQVSLDPIRADFIPLPAGHAYRFMRVSVNYFVEE